MNGSMHTFAARPSAGAPLPGKADEHAEPALAAQMALLVRHRVLIVSVTALSVASVFLVTLRLPKIFRARATMIVAVGPPQILGKDFQEVTEQGSAQSGYWWSREYMVTQMRILESVSLQHRVIEKLHLTSDRRFFKKEETAPLPLHEALRRLQKILRADVMRDSRLIVVAVEHQNRELATQIANAACDALLELGRESKQETTQFAARWLSDQLDDLRKQLEQSEMALYKFKRDNDILLKSMSVEDRQSVLSSSIQRINDELMRTRARRIELQARQSELRSLGHKDLVDVPALAVVQDGLIQRLRERYVDDSHKLEELRARYGPRNPLVREGEAKAAAARRDLARQIDVMLEAMEREHRTVVKAERGLQTEMERLKREVETADRLEIEYKQLKRNQDTNARLYGTVLGRLKDSDLTRNLATSNISILDRAIVPARPVRPRLFVNLGVAVLLGLLLGGAAAVFVEYQDRSIKSHEDVERYLRLPFLGLLPSFGPSGDTEHPIEIHVHSNPQSTAAESARAIRTSLLFMSPDKPLRSVLVLSGSPGEGKTLTAISLAVVMAQGGTRTLLVDTDLRRSRLHRVFRLPADRGITNLILASTSLDEVVSATQVPNLFVLPCGPSPPNPSEILNTDRFRQILGTLTAKWDFVVFDSPPCLPVTDAVVLSTQVDGAILVVRAGQTHRAVAAQAKRQVQDVGGNVVGCVLNDIDLSKRRYGSGYYYYYYHRNRGYYRYVS